jgi:hypothetical protein
MANDPAVVAAILRDAPDGPIELTKPSGDVIFIAPATRAGVAWQGSKFDKHGPYGHNESQSREQAVERAVDDGFHTLSPGALDDLYAAHGGSWWTPDHNR